MRASELARIMREAGMSEAEIDRRVAKAKRSKQHAEEAARKFYRSWNSRYTTQLAVCRQQSSRTRHFIVH